MNRSILILASIAVCLLCTKTQGASLYGKVVNVNSGDEITIFNLNRPVRVKLLGVDAPEVNQEFGEVAKKHLSDLVFDKLVLVEYSGIGPDKSITGRVLLNNADVGAQMIRDGAAWYDPGNKDRLSETDREVYQQSQQAARNERRGLWQIENPTAPWEFVKAQSLKITPTASLKSGVTATTPRPQRQLSELTNLTLLRTESSASASRQLSRSEIEAAWESLTASNKEWRLLQPPDQNFSAFVPEGRQLTQPTPLAGETVDLNLYIARDGANLYAVFWLTGPSNGETDKLAIDETVLGFIKASHKEYESGDRGYFLCGQQREKDISMNGYTGREFDMSSCSLPTRARAFTKVAGDRRQMYAAVVFYGDSDANVARFIKSFVAGRQKIKTR